MEMTPRNFPNVGYIMMKFDDHELAELKADAQSLIDQNFENSNEYNQNLAGNLHREYEYTKLDLIHRLISPSIDLYNKEYPMFLRRQDYFDGPDLPRIKLCNCWINFQSKHEFNPFHTHSGVYSFVIWLDIPYNIKHENALSSVKKSNSPGAGRFQFLYTSALGTLQSENIHADVHLINHGLLFPAQMPHIVYPFYTSNSYRISVSGNYKFVV
jgi:hypothetical protein